MPAMATALHLPTGCVAPARSSSSSSSSSSCATKTKNAHGPLAVRVPDGNDRTLPLQLWRRAASEVVVRQPMVRRSAETTGASVSVDVATGPGGVTEVDKDTFWPFVKDAGDKLVVLDMYTQWCGPCKLMLPKVVALSETYSEDVVFAKLDCNQENKVLAKGLGVKSVPTFKIFKQGHEVAEVRGAKYDELVSAIERARSSSSS